MIETSTRRLALTDEQVELYQEDGYIVLKGRFSLEEAAEFRREAHDLMERLLRFQEIDATWGSARGMTDRPATKLLHCHNVQFQSATLGRLMSDPRLVDPIADLIGPNVQLHHNKLFIKPPEKGSHGF